MRKISNGAIYFTFFLMCLAAIASIVTIKFAFYLFDFGNFEEIIFIGGGIFVFYLYSILIYRVFLIYRQIPEGLIEKGSSDEFAHNVYVLFFLILFRSLIGTKIIPVPINRVIYLLLGARLGANTYCAGIILDPPLTEIGSNSIIGHDATLYSHVIEGDTLAYKKIIIGDNVTIGAHSIVMSGTKIGSNSIIAAGSVVLKDTTIGENEMWKGIPADFHKSLKK